MPATLKQQIDSIYSLSRYGIKPGLTTIRSLLGHLDNPHDKFASLHIAGTNGKGSVTAMLASILTASGLKIGRYTSPHLFSFNERININRQDITDSKLAALIESTRQAVNSAGLKPTFFEFTTALAFQYFAQHKVDLAVIEVGMGGLLDATNVITPDLSIITNIGLDHTRFLGSTKQEIATKKAGIIKPSKPVLIAESDPDLVNLLSDIAAQHNSPVYHIDDLHPTLGSFHAPLPGPAQARNTRTALAGLRLVKPHLSIESIQTGLDQTNWPGRLDLISSAPYILVDGAHNTDSFEELYRFITHRKTKPDNYTTLICSLKQDSDPEILVNKIAPLFNQVITTEGAYQPLPAEKLAGLMPKPARPIPSAAEATRAARSILDDSDSLVITGSLYMIPAALAEISGSQVRSPLIP